MAIHADDPTADEVEEEIHMLATRRSVATALLGIASTCLALFDPATVGRATGVAVADENVRIESPADGSSVTGVIDIPTFGCVAPQAAIGWPRTGQPSFGARHVALDHTACCRDCRGRNRRRSGRGPGHAARAGRSR